MASLPNLSFIVAVDKKCGIGGENRLLWNLPGDMKFFKEKTMGHTVIMGRKTYDSIGRPLKGRRNIILSKNQDLKIEGCEVIHSIPECLNIIESNQEEIFVIGGSSIFEQTMDYASHIYITVVDGEFPADRFFPDIFNAKDWEENKKFRQVFEKDEINPYSFTIHQFEKKSKSSSRAYKSITPLSQFKIDLVHA